MDTIDLNQLQGYEEDAKGLRDFQRPYALPSVLGLIVFLAGFILMISEMEASHYHQGQPSGILDRIWFQAESIGPSAGLPPALLPYLPFVLFAAGFLLLFVTAALLGRATPASRTGQPMERFLNADAPAGVKEIVYVDRASQTYFRRVVSRVTRGGPSIR